MPPTSVNLQGYISICFVLLLLMPVPICFVHLLLSSNRLIQDPKKKHTYEQCKHTESDEDPFS